jgi:hypothetical protein
MRKGGSEPLQVEESLEESSPGGKVLKLQKTRRTQGDWPLT